MGAETMRKNCKKYAKNSHFSGMTQKK